MRSARIVDNRAEPFDAVIRTHPARADAAERQILLRDVQQLLLIPTLPGVVRSSTLAQSASAGPK